MRLSQLTRRIDRDDTVMVFDEHAPIDQNLLYAGRVRGIKRDDPINGAFVESVAAQDNRICILISTAGKKPKS